MTIRRFISLLKERKTLKHVLRFYVSGYLYDIGWFNAYKLKKPVDQNNQPIPWVTYSFIDFITGRLDKTMTLLEYGSGNSTMFYGARVKSVQTVEHNKEWFDMISSQMPSNVEIKFVELQEGGAYSQYGKQFPNTFDIVIVDGRDRVNCLKNSVDSLTSRGVMILDDSERERYQDGMKFLTDRGFRRLDFTGISPGEFYYKSTSVFYKDNNCLKI
jgi:hypothetical protein